MNEMSLFHIELEIKNLLENLENLTTTSDEENNRLVSLSVALMEKTDQVAHYRESLKAYSELLTEKIDELIAREDQIQKKMERFDAYVSNCMAIHDKDTFEGKFCKIKKRKPTPAVEIVDETKIPIEFIKIPEPKPIIMKAEIARCLKAGEIIEGARLVDGKTSIQYSLK